MPDFERLTDSLALHLSKTAQERAELAAYIRGKTRARIEIAILAAALAALILIINAVS